MVDDRQKMDAYGHPDIGIFKIVLYLTKSNPIH
jgi:hypothetical protein